MIVLLAVLGIGLVATPIVLENMDPAPVVSNTVNKPTVNYSPAPVVKEDIKVINENVVSVSEANEKVGKLLVEWAETFLTDRIEMRKIYKTLQNEDLRKNLYISKIKEFALKEEVLINKIKSITKDHSKRFAVMIKNLEGECDAYKNKVDAVYDTWCGRWKDDFPYYYTEKPDHDIIYSVSSGLKLPGFYGSSPCYVLDDGFVFFGKGVINIKEHRKKFAGAIEISGLPPDVVNFSQTQYRYYGDPSPQTKYRWVPPDKDCLV